MSRPPVRRKQILRRQMREKLAAIAPEERRQRAAAVADRALSLDLFDRPRRVLSCLSFGIELDTRRLIDRLLGDGHEVLVPRADFATRQLSLHYYPCDLETLDFGLEQPSAATAALADEQIGEDLDAALIVGLAFDRRGYRLGHGGGFFDRFLAAHSVQAIGLAYELQIVDALPTEPHDQPVGRIVSESRVLMPAI